jgi:hypothetical protein
MRSITSIQAVGLFVAFGGFVTPSVAKAEDTASPVTAPQPASTAPPAPPAGEAPPAKAAGENRPAPNSVYVEGLGAGLVYSINYERMVADEVGVRVGFSYLSFGATASAGGQTSSASASFVTIPITASYIGVRRRSSSLELGGGATIAYASGSASGVGASASGSGMTPYGVAMVGYRLHPVDHPGFQLRVGLMALVGQGLALSNADPRALGVLPWGYLSLGASF